LSPIASNPFCLAKFRRSSWGRANAEVAKAKKTSDDARILLAMGREATVEVNERAKKGSARHQCRSLRDGRKTTLSTIEAAMCVAEVRSRTAKEKRGGERREKGKGQPDSRRQEKKASKKVRGRSELIQTLLCRNNAARHRSANSNNQKWVKGTCRLAYWSLDNLGSGPCSITRPLIGVGEKKFGGMVTPMMELRHCRWTSRLGATIAPFHLRVLHSGGLECPWPGIGLGFTQRDQW